MTMATSFVPAGSTNYTLVGTADDDILDALTGGGNNILQGGDGNDELFAYTNDKLFGEAGNDELHSEGNGGNTLDGGDGNDIIFADRNDTILGGAGDDTIFGGRGGNTLTGGTGNDTFWLANAEYPISPNIITDFNPTEDRLQIALDGITLDKLSFVPQGNDTLISINSTQLAILKNQNYELPIFTITSASAIEGSAINFTVTRTGDKQTTRSVTASTAINTDDTASASDLTANTQTLTFAQGETTKTFTVQTTQDSLFEGNETFTVSLSNPSNDAVVSPNNGTAKGTINNDDNKKPNLQSFTQNGQEDQIISFGIGDFKDKGKYQDEDNNDLMAIKVISLPTAGSLTFVNGQQVTVNQEISVNDLANLRYNPVVNANGNVATLTVAAIDNGTPKVESDPATITINLTPVNDPPVAQNDQLSVSQGSAGTINPLNNDNDPEGDSLKITGKTDGKYGKVEINGNNLTYTLLDGNYLGNDVFSYIVSDGSLSASADVRVTVTGKAATGTVAPTQLISIAPVDKLIPQEAGTLTGIVDKLGYEFPNNYNPSLVKNSLQNALNQTTAAFNNLFGLYEVDNVTGSVNGIKPGESGYAKAALSKVVDNFIVRVGGSSSGAASDVVVSGGKIYSPFVIANGGNFSGNLQQAINAFFAANPNNSPATAQNYTTLPVAYFSFGVANPDGAAHLRSFGNNTFGFEDLPAGVGVSDYDFNDAVFSFGAVV
jgi:3-phytase